MQTDTKLQKQRRKYTTDLQERRKSEKGETLMRIFGINWGRLRNRIRYHQNQILARGFRRWTSANRRIIRHLDYGMDDDCGNWEVGLDWINWVFRVRRWNGDEDDGDISILGILKCAIATSTAPRATTTRTN